MRYHLTPTRMAIGEKQKIRIAKDVKKLKHLYVAGRM